MERDESLLRVSHYRCRCCHQISPLSAKVCTNPGCGVRLTVYADVVPGEDQRAAEKREEITWEPDAADNQKQTKEKPAKRQKQPKEKRQKRQPEQDASQKKKKLLIWLDGILALIYGMTVFLVIIFDAEWTFGVILFTAVLAAAVLLARKEKYVLHGLLSILNAVIVFVSLVLFLQEIGLLIAILLDAGYVTVAVLSFLKKT